MTKLEEIARAICEESGLTWESATQGYRERCADFALAAVRAMREPSEAMVDSGADWNTVECAAHCWRSMIDSILSEAGEKPQGTRE